MKTPMNGWTLAFMCPSCVGDAPLAHPEDELVMGMRALPVGLGCVADMLTEGYELVETGEHEGVYYLLCPHEEETSRPYREAEGDG